ncbi:hypothetical protein FKP32DRAFT_1679477 [Trametes sanguinea]|nr:hypothetical protein FKP32DRAFT_1679477 [Trametes sanguinea]
MVQLYVRGNEYVKKAWKRAAFQLAECLSSAYRADHFRLTKPQIDWIVCEILWAVWPVPIESDNLKGEELKFQPKDGVVASKGLTDAFHDLLHDILTARRSYPDKADVMSPDVAEFAVVIGFHRMQARTLALQKNPASIADWFSTACAAVDLMAILSQISPMKMTDVPLSFQAQASMELEPNRFVDERSSRLDRQQFLAIGRAVLDCLSVGLVFNATPAQSANIKWSLSDLLDVVPHLYQTLGDYAQLFGPLMPDDLPLAMRGFNDALSASLSASDPSQRRNGSLAVASKSLSALLKYTLARIEIANNPANAG